MTDSAGFSRRDAGSRLDEFFDEAPRVRYDKAPLSQVICQFRYPPILKIDSVLPAEFQEIVREQFPLFEQVGGFGSTFQPPPSLPVDLSSIFAAQMGGAGYRFKTDDGAATIDLNSNFVGVTVNKYPHWERFKKLAELSYTTLISVYKPAYFSRIGLRYVNIIDKKKIGATGTPWSRLLSEGLYLDYFTHKYEDNVDELNKTIRLRHGNGGILLRSGMIKDVNDTDKSSYLIDFDYYVDVRTELERANAVVEELHRLSGRAFRWAISDELHNLLGPVPI